MFTASLIAQKLIEAIRLISPQEWNILPDMKVARSFVAAVATGGVLYAIGTCLINSMLF